MKRKKIACLLGCGVLGLLIVGGIHLNAYPTKAYDLTLNLFESRAMQFEEKACLSTDSKYSNDETGVRVRGQMGSYLEMNGMSGGFDMAFVPEGGLKGVTFTFTDETTKNSFDLVLNYEDKNISSYVQCAEEKVGLYYDTNFGLVNVTPIHNAVGRYTTTSNDYKATDVSFDPETMSVAVEDKIVWVLNKNFSDGKSVGFAFDGFETYTMRMSFSSVNGESSAIIYSVNDYAFTNEVLIPSVAPRLYANFTHEGVVGCEYTLPLPYAYDVAEGAISAEEVDVTVSLGSENILVNDGKFTPSKAGEYTILYSVENSVGLACGKSYTLTVHEKADGEFLFENVLPEQTLGVNTLAYFPSVTYENPAILTVQQPVVCAEIFKDGQSVLKKDNVSEGFAFAFAQTGEYEVVFSPVYPYYAQDTYRYEINVEDGVGYVLSAPIQNYYASGDMFKVPSLTFQTAQGEIEATSIMQFPDGACYSANNIELSQEGEYTLIYTADDGANTYKKTFSFFTKVALDSLFETTGTVSMYNGSYSWNENYTGLVAELSTGATMTYKNVVDLSKYNFEPGKENQPLFEVLIDPYTAYRADAVLFEFVLTDLYNPNNQVTIQLTTMQEELESSWGVLRAGHSGYGTVGLEGDVDEKNNYTGLLWRNTTSGFLFNGSITASPNENFKEQIIPTSIYFDYEDRSIHADNHVGQRHLIADLDHESYFSVPWDGFTTGECTITLNIKQLSGSQARLVFLSMDGNDFSEHDFIDNTPPEVSVDIGEEEIAFGVVGKPYPLFDAFAVDNINGVVNASKEVFYLYGGNKFHVDVKNNAFTPEYAGDYLVVYSARDISGNIGTYEFKVKVQEDDFYDESPLSIALSEGYPTQTTVGRLIQIAKVESVFGGVGRNEYYVEVTDENGKEVDLVKDCFRPIEAGKYTVRYHLSDYIGEKAEYTYEVNVTAHDGVIYQAEKVSFPKVVLAGIEYELPTILAYDYKTGVAVEKQTTVSIIDQNGKNVALIDGKLVVSDPNITSVKIIYGCEGRTENYTKEIPVRVVVDEYDRYQFTSYFYGENVVIQQDTNAVLVTTQTQGAMVEFLKSVIGTNFSFALQADQSKQGLQAFSVYLTNAANVEQFLKFTIIKDGDGALVRINDGEAVSIVGSFTGASNYDFALHYKAYQKAFFDARGAKLAIVKTYANGDVFDGFSGSTVKVSVCFDEFVGEAGIRMVSLNGQSFVENGSDAIVPEVSYAQTIGGLYEIGEVITINDYYATDVLGNVHCFVTVKLGNQYVKDTQGNTLKEYPYYEGLSLEFTAPGDYFIYLVAKDYVWLDGKIEYGERNSVKLPTVSVNTEAVPTLTIEGNVPSSAKVGDRISLPAPKTNAENAKLLVLVIDPYGTNWYVEADENGKYAYTLQMKGTHTIKFIVMDRDFNYLELVKTIQVS